MKNNKGFTLVELILTIALIGLVLQVAYLLLFVGTTSYSVSTNKGFAQQDIRLTADLLTKELRLITDISDDPYVSNEYFSMRIDNEGKLVTTKHVYHDNDTSDPSDDYTVDTVLSAIGGNWDMINITNDRSGVIDIELKQTESSGMRDGSYELPVSVYTENTPSMQSNIDIDLVNGDVLYYRNSTISALSHGIDLDITGQDSENNNVIVSFYSNYNSNTLLSSVSGETGTTKDLPSAPTRIGYSFVRWDTDSDGSGTSYGAAGATTFTMPSNNTDLYAIWEENTGLLTKVTINTSSGNEGIITIDGSAPTLSNGRYRVKKNDGSIVRIRLQGYTTDHDGMVTITLNNTSNANIVESGGVYEFTFLAKASKNGANENFSVQIQIVTVGHTEYYKTYDFVTY